ncbi:N-hydroxyarylamine O-acetyltransferase [Algoriphagus sp. 4150]|uniref:arylamine N-acetyltransferase family protein n=1 Tax=Algoriphagus sp. 4150 TaxID=2817756 RepID=UPI002856FE30|nr:arylamine N-acetyltransferase [Algoriphagus sp. 4150]MDR7129314.1 N-hydroxyarylamine O-acetyltransferase [Algoriphagus sp. 4150]
MNKAKYLERIDYTDGIDATDDVLTELHKKHVYQIPFENLDVYYSRRFDLDIERIYKKVINDRRGGFCYELNLLFNKLLTGIGFTSRIIASRIIDQDGTLGPELDHMAIYVKTEKEFLLDVGYGDLFITPLEIRSGVQYDGRNYFQIDKWNQQEYLLSMSADGVDFSKRYTFSLDVVNAEDFDAICLDKQTNPDSYFVKNVICTKPTETGRVTIFNDKFMERKGELRIETPILGEDGLTRYLKDKFSIMIRRQPTNK